MGTECIIKGCTNRSYQRDFVNQGTCRSCYNMLITGKLWYGTTFIHDLAKKKKPDAKDADSFEADILKLLGVGHLSVTTLGLFMKVNQDPVAQIYYYGNKGLQIKEFTPPLKEKIEERKIEEAFNEWFDTKHGMEVQRDLAYPTGYKMKEVWKEAFKQGRLSTIEEIK